MSDHAAGLALELQHTDPEAERLRRYGWRVGAHALQPIQRRRVRRAGLLRRLLACLLKR